MADKIALFFDIGDTLAVPTLTAARKLDKLIVFPFVPEILTKLHATTGPGGSTLRLGIISNTGDETLVRMKEVLSDSGLLGFFEAGLLVFSSVEGSDKTSRKIFDAARARSGLGADRCIYVGENDAERTVAASAGFRVSFHALHVFHAIGQVTP